MKTLYFKRKSYGYGWTPATWQGWGITIAYAVILIVLGSSVDTNNSREVMLMFVLPFLILTIAFIGIAYKTGEKPRWQWGNKGGNKKQ